ncbi:MAG: Flp pilus assembly complex ATPase component TadA [Candidatus Aenigmarchaeota archaeon]|nr:Flp pilus assembly complex ATPase component TadA [Candidatus Aenigmarchaeota archaeon]
MVYEAEVKDGIMRINCLGGIYGASLEDSDHLMAIVMDRLMVNRDVSEIVLAETRENEYDFEQTKMLIEIVNAINEIVKEKKILSIKNIAKPGSKYGPEWYGWLQNLILIELKRDPIGAYLKLKRKIRHLKIKMLSEDKEEIQYFLENALLPIKEILEKCKLIQLAKPFLTGYHAGDRTLYRKFFRPTVRPNFMYTKYMTQRPRGEIVAKYKLGDIDVEIFKVPGKVRHVYHITPPEFRLSEDEYVLLDGARRILEERRPKELEIKEQEKIRELFTSLGSDLIRDLADQMKITLKSDQLNKLTEILTRYTAGLGIIDLLLKDDKIQDIYINSPLGIMPVYILHQDFEECETNLVPTKTDGERWATRFKLLSGRPLDEANPVLDTEIIIPGGTARVAAIGPNLSPEGLAFALRRHRYSPWTFPLFIKAKFFDPLFAGLMWFTASYGRTFLVAGTRGAGKTSFLGSMMLQILPYYRMITVEDSVTGDSRIIIKRNGKFEKIEIGKLIDEQINKYTYRNNFGRQIVDNFENIKIFSFDSEGKIRLSNVSSFIRHKVNKDLYELETSTGRKLKVTGDHSLFTIGDDSVLKEIKTNELKEGDFIAVPRKLIFNSQEKQNINLLEHLDVLEKYYVTFPEIKNFIETNWVKIKDISRKLLYSKSMPSVWKRNEILPVKVFKELYIKDINPTNVQFKPKNGGKPIKCIISLDQDFLNFIGLWLADGCYDKHSIIMSVSSKEEKDLVKRVAKKLGLNIKTHPSDGISSIINSILFKDILINILDLKGNAYTKEIPSWIFDLSEKQKAYVLKGIFSGDGCAGKKEIAIPLSSEKLLYDIQTLLLSYGIIFRKSNKRRKDGTFNASITCIDSFRKFQKYIGFLQKEKNQKLSKLCSKISIHDTSDIIPISLEIKNELSHICKNFNKYDYITRSNNIGRQYLKKLISNINISKIPNPVKFLPFTDILWDKIKSIRKLESKEEYVYDISVPEFENFVCENIIAHNTLELPVEAMRKLGYNIERMKSRSVITRVETELPAEEALRTALRLGDSCLFMGEVRSSLRGNEEVVIVENGQTKRIPIKDIERKDIKNIKVPTLDKQLNISLTKLTGFVKHPKRKKLLEIITKTGRKVTVTHDHSVFTHTNFKVHPTEASKIKPGDKIIIPAKMPCGYNDMKYFDLTELLQEFKLAGAEGLIRKAISKLGWKKASKLCKVNDIYRYLLSTQKTRIPISKFKTLMKKANIKYSLDNLKIKRVTSETLPAKLPINKDFCRFLGYYVAEGYVSSDKNGVIITNSNKKIIKDIFSISNSLFGREPSIRETKGLGKSKQIRIQNSPLGHLILRLGCGRTSRQKRIPSFIYGLSKEKICAFLKGMYSGDGSFTASKSTGNAVRYFSISKKLAEDVLYLLLTLGIVARIYRRKQKGREKYPLYVVEFKQRQFVEKFLKEVGFTHKKPKIIKKAFAHTKDNSVIFDPKELERHIKLSREYRHLRRTCCCSKEYLQRVANNGGSEQLKKFAAGKFYIDEVKEIKEIELNQAEYVYDLSVNPTENFIGGFGGIVLHNTEAKALYEAMRIGALANVVAGTIHGESAYGVFDRVVNDLGVPKTSFKATDLVIICNKLKTQDGLHSFRRIVELTEVRKHWNTDPREEGGFVNLMEYSSKNDKLMPTDTLLNGESYILNQIAKRVPGWTGRWNVVWENIELRAKILKTMVDIAEKIGNNNLLEAPVVVESNQMFHIISNRNMLETGTINSDTVYNEWLEWFKKKAKLAQ